MMRPASPPRTATFLLACCLLLGLPAGCAPGREALLGAQRHAGPIPSTAGQLHWVPVTGAGGARRLILARLCRPHGPSPHPLVVINHGKASNPRERSGQRVALCGAEAVRWFLDRGFVAVLPLRRGYGATGGRMAEALPPCSPTRDYVPAALETARDIRAAIDYATALPGIRAERVVVVGQSAGGLGSIAYSSLGDARVVALVNMAGGDGGHAGGRAGQVCHPAALVRAAAWFGAHSRTPMLWIYTANDSYFAPEIAAAMHRAYEAQGGQAELHALPNFGRDGHTLFFARGGAAVWGGLVARFLRLHDATS